MVDRIVEASEARGRVDIQVGPGRRRRRSDEAKGRMVAESYAPGAVVSEVARQNVECRARRLHAFRERRSRFGSSALPKIPGEDAPAKGDLRALDNGHVFVVACSHFQS
jgi:transposase